MKAAFVVRYEYPDTVNLSNGLLVQTSGHLGGIILRGGRQCFRSELRHSGGTIIIFTQARVIGGQFGSSLTPGKTYLREIQCQVYTGINTVTLNDFYAIIMDTIPNKCPDKQIKGINLVMIGIMLKKIVYVINKNEYF